MNRIRNVVAREILDSRGNPTVEVQEELGNAAEFAGGKPFRHRAS